MDGLVLTPVVRTGAKTSSCVLVRPLFAGMVLVRRWPLSSVLRWSPPLVRLPTTEVVASAGETVGATCCRTSGSLALMVVVVVVGAEAVVVVGADVVASAGEPLGVCYPAVLLVWR